MLKLQDGIKEIIRKTATSLPRDVEAALVRAYEGEADGSPAKEVLASMLENVSIAKSSSKPLCQDSGTPIFYARVPRGLSFPVIEKSIIEGVRLATGSVPLRPNAVDVLTDKNSGDNTGIGFPEIYFEQSEEDTLVIDLSLKGAGSENAGTFYKLPDERLKAERDLEGVRKCVLDAVYSIQGRACPPYTVGVGIAGTRIAAAALSRKALMSKLTDEPGDDRIRELEKKLLAQINELGIGAMGLGGSCTALGVKIKHAHRHTGSYFVDISIACWANRRSRLIW
ncbi:MAG: fumarate hydratase [Nitrospiraceae bacterium]|nr:fumarate hydratase [Nitrospiraceae bacterium]